MNHKSEIAAAIVTNPKAGAGVATTTTALGVGTWVDFIPDDIGKVATLVGIALSLIIIYTTLSKFKAEQKKNNLEVEKLKLEIDARREEAAARRAQGLPSRRAEDVI